MANDKVSRPVVEASALTAHVNERHDNDDTQHVILFYKYHALPSNHSVLDVYCSALERLCQELNLLGRILVGASANEGINGTLAGKYHEVHLFTLALQPVEETSKAYDDNRIQRFHEASQAFFQQLQQPDLWLQAADFKWSRSTRTEPLFPDLQVKVVKELIGTGGALDHITLDQTGQGYLTAREWHNTLLQQSLQDQDDALLIDCRNTKEYQVGHFAKALDPQTTTFAQFPQWVRQHQPLLSQKKRIFMYCTGGIRCEKASALVRHALPDDIVVQHLQGGIHKYLEEFGNQDDSLWRGQNFVFDRRVTDAGDSSYGVDGNGESRTNDSKVDTVAQCLYCQAPNIQFRARNVCVVCREPVLVCERCAPSLLDYHCANHFQLKECYFRGLERFDRNEIERQQYELKEAIRPIAVGRKFKQRRRTLQRQLVRLNARLDGFSSPDVVPGITPKNCSAFCRSCGDSVCTGSCWGFYGLKRKEALANHDRKATPKHQHFTTHKRHRLLLHQVKLGESDQSDCSMGPWMYRDPASGIRVPPSFIRHLECYVKAKWSGRLMLELLQEQFHDLQSPLVLAELFDRGLIRLNDKTVQFLEASNTRLKLSDKLSRLTHWHDAPVVVPELLSIDVVTLPLSVCGEHGIAEEDAKIYVCNKPSSVPVHAAGPYLHNTLLAMAEAQLNLPRKRLRPLHRTDRVTSGLTLCCTNATVSRLFSRCLTNGHVDKVYLACVDGRFPVSAEEFLALSLTPDSHGMAKCDWQNETTSIRVSAPVETVNPADGIRGVTLHGKPALSVFQSISYDKAIGATYVLCRPVSGRNHQLLVHLQLLGYPIRGDVVYGGQSMNLDGSLHRRAIALMAEQSTKSISADPEGRAVIGDRERIACQDACQFCRTLIEGEPENTFSDAQFLKSGHAIQLHALKYRLGVPTKKRSKGIVSEQDVADIEVVDFEVGLPEWCPAKLAEKVQQLVSL